MDVAIQMKERGEIRLLPLKVEPADDKMPREWNTYQIIHFDVSYKQGLSEIRRALGIPKTRLTFYILMGVLVTTMVVALLLKNVTFGTELGEKLPVGLTKAANVSVAETDELEMSEALQPSSTSTETTSLKLTESELSTPIASIASTSTIPLTETILSTTTPSAPNIPATITSASCPTPQVRTLVNVNVRSGPGIDYEIITTVNQKIFLNVIAKDENGFWYNILLEGDRRGWVAASKVELMHTETCDQEISIAVTTPALPLPTHSLTVAPTSQNNSGTSTSPLVSPTDTPLPTKPIPPTATSSS